MQSISSSTDLHDTVEGWKNAGARIGFVPTMGALHEGHLSLVKIAQEQAARVIVSIYVNPTQFAPHEDFDAYPRDIEGDLDRLRALGVDAVYLPRTEDIYPNGPQITVRAGKAGEGLDTDFRPHFFHGVATVVHRLFELVRPDVAVFGEKDFQQLMVIKEMVAAQNLPIEIIGGPTARDEHGLALSSRNAYLNDDQLKIARTLNIILHNARLGGGNVVSGNMNGGSGAGLSEAALEKTKAEILAAGFDKVDYVTERWGRLLAAGWVGKTRLIDNIAL